MIHKRHRSVAEEVVRNLHDSRADCVNLWAVASDAHHLDEVRAPRAVLEVFVSSLFLRHAPSGCCCCVASSLSFRFCRCGRPFDSRGHHRAVCAQAGVLGRRGCLVCCSVCPFSFDLTCCGLHFFLLLRKKSVRCMGGLFGSRKVGQSTKIGQSRFGQSRSSPPLVKDGFFFRRAGSVMRTK